MGVGGELQEAAVTPRESIPALVARLRQDGADGRLLAAVEAGGRLYDACDETERGHGEGCEGQSCTLRRAAMAAWEEVAK